MYNFTYRMSVFIDTKDLEITPDITTRFMNALNSNGARFIPAMITEPILAPFPQQSKRIQYAFENTTVRLLNERVDVEQAFECDLAGILVQKEAYETLLSYLNTIMEAIARNGARLAFRTENIIDLENKEKLDWLFARNNYGLDVISAPIHGWNHEMSVRKSLDINGKNEACNILVQIGEGSISKINVQPQVAHEGLIVMIELNTIAENSYPRFSFTDFQAFFEQAIVMQDSIRKHFDDLCL